MSGHFLESGSHVFSDLVYQAKWPKFQITSTIIHEITDPFCLAQTNSCQYDIFLSNTSFIRMLDLLNLSLFHLTSFDIFCYVWVHFEFACKTRQLLPLGLELVLFEKSIFGVSSSNRHVRSTITD